MTDYLTVNIKFQHILRNYCQNTLNPANISYWPNVGPI